MRRTRDALTREFRARTRQIVDLDMLPIDRDEGRALVASTPPTLRGCIIDHSREDELIARWLGKEALRRG